MSESLSFHTVGYVKDAHGIKGEVFVRMFAKEADYLQKVKVANLRHRETGLELQFEIERMRPHKDGLVMVLKGVVDRNKAETLKGMSFNIDKDLLISKPGEKIYLDEVLGFEVVDQQMGSIGIVQGFSSNGPQDLLEVKNEIHDVLVPFIQPFIEKIEFNEKRIYMKLPEGLCDLTS